MVTPSDFYNRPLYVYTRAWEIMKSIDNNELVNNLFSMRYKTLAYVF